MPDIVAENADASGLHAEQPGDDGKQRALARAVEAEQGRKAPRRNREADIVERLAGAVAMADTLDRQRYRIPTGWVVKAACLVAGDGNVGFRHCLPILIPHRNAPP